MTKPETTLSQDQALRHVLYHLRQRAPTDVAYFVVANGRWRSRTEAGSLNGLGTMPGIPSLILIRSGAVYGLQVKAVGGRLSWSQIMAQSRLRDAGAHVATAYGVDQALETLTGWDMLAPPTYSGVTDNLGR